MLTKLLFTALIIAGAVVYIRHRSASGQRGSNRQTPTASAWYWRVLPGGLLAVLLGVGALVFWLEWQEEHRIFTLRVIDSRTGQVTTYPVYRDAVEGRRFQTVDGRIVTLADVERMELTDEAP